MLTGGADGDRRARDGSAGGVQDVAGDGRAVGAGGGRLGGGVGQLVLGATRERGHHDNERSDWSPHERTGAIARAMPISWRSTGSLWPPIRSPLLSRASTTSCRLAFECTRNVQGAIPRG